jgi:hypothetical protein
LGAWWWTWVRILARSGVGITNTGKKTAFSLEVMHEEPTLEELSQCFGVTPNSFKRYPNYSYLYGYN